MQFDVNTKNKQLLQSCLTKYMQQSLKAWDGQTYIIGEDRLYKGLVHADGGGQFKKFTTESSSKALPLFYILLRVNIDVIIYEKWRIFKIRWRVMLHNQVAIDVSTALQEKVTTKSNAELNFFSTIGVI